MEKVFRKKIREHRSGGFTLIELMVVVSIMTILVGLLYQIWMSNEGATRTLDTKVKMRDEARVGVMHMVRNLRMADAKLTELAYIDANDAIVAWPPAAGVLARGIIFRRPMDNDGDGNPYTGAGLNVDWSGQVTFRVDTNDINNDGNTGQVVQLLNGAFVKVLISDIAPASQDMSGTIYDTPSAGGFWIRCMNPTENPPNLIQISLVQQRGLGTVPGSVVSYYEDFVRFRNNTTDAP